MSSRPVARRTAGCTWSHQNDQNASHSLGMSSSVNPACSSRLFQTWTWLVDAAHRQRVQRPLPGLRVEQHPPGERVRIEQVREVADSVREVHEPIVEGPFPDVAVNGVPNAKSGGWPASSAASILSGSSACWIENELDLLAAVLLKGGDGLPDRRVLLGVEPLLPPHHEVGGLAPSGARTSAAARRRMTQPLHGCSLRQDLLDAGDRLVDRLLGADALGGDAVDGLAPDVAPARSNVAAIARDPT